MLATSIDYHRIAAAIGYLKDNFKAQPSLQEVAATVHLSPAHFQRLFTDWAGVSPKKFVQYLTAEYAKTFLANENNTLLDVACETGLSGTGRLHDLFVRIEGMTPGEYKNGGENLDINYRFADSPFGNVIVASTSRGICHLAFEDDQGQAILNLRQRFPNANYHKTHDKFQLDALTVFQSGGKLEQIKLYLPGTPFQLKVWNALLNIPEGRLVAYGTVAQTIGRPGASRAVGSAIGKNPVAYLIPCHRVIQSTGKAGNYMWGRTRKLAMIGWEAAKTNR